MEHRGFPEWDNCGVVRAAKPAADVSQAMKIALVWQEKTLQLPILDARLQPRLTIAGLKSRFQMMKVISCSALNRQKTSARILCQRIAIGGFMSGDKMVLSGDACSIIVKQFAAVTAKVDAD